MAKLCFFGALVLIILVQSPLVFSYSCDDVSSENRASCLEIENSNLSLVEKQLIISNLEYVNKFEPNHFFISSNNNIIIEDAPDGTRKHDDGYIENAWMEIFAVMPSVIYNGSLYVPSVTKVLSGFNYELDAPTQNPVSGDCKTTYQLLQNYAENKVYVNNIYQGTGRLVPININQNSEIKSSYSIMVQYKIKHYEWERYCCRRNDDGKCTRRCRRCDYSHNEISQDRITIEDSVNIKFYNNELSANVVESSQLPSSTQLKINYSDSVEVSFVNSNYNYYKYIFEIVDSFYPYNILTLKAQDYKAESFANIFKNGDYLIVGDNDECKIRGFDFFNIIEKDCSAQNSYVGLNIKTNKLSYNSGEEIELNIYPGDILVNISYNGQSFLAKKDASLIAEESSNKIIVNYGWESTQKIIYVKNKSRILLVYQVTLVILVFVVLYVLVKKYWRQIWQNVGS
jgi:hypothetical protein